MNKPKDKQGKENVTQYKGIAVTQLLKGFSQTRARKWVL